MNSISGLYVSWNRILRSFLKFGTVVAALAAGVIPVWAQSNLGASDRWVRAADRSQQRIEHQAVTLKNGKLMVMGGYDVEALDILFGNGQGSALESAEIYDPKSNIWSLAAPMPQPAG